MAQTAVRLEPGTTSYTKNGELRLNSASSIEGLYGCTGVVNIKKRRKYIPSFSDRSTLSPMESPYFSLPKVLLECWADSP